MALYLGGIMLMSALVFWWYHHKETRRIHHEQSIALKLYDVQCERLLRHAPEGFECSIEKPDFSTAYNTLHQEIAIAALLIILFGALLSFYLARLSLRPMRDAIAMMDDFVESMIHDLNTPLSAAQLNADALLKQNLDPAQSKRVKRIIRGLQLMQTLETQLRTAMQHAQISYTDKELSLCAVCESVKERCELIALSCHDPAIIVADELMITRIIDNLITNALKYNRNSNGIKMVLQGNKLSVIDHGIGMRHPERIFERYYREKSSMPGLGLGLGIVKSVCDHYRITVSVKSKIDHGTTIALDFTAIAAR